MLEKSMLVENKRIAKNTLFLYFRMGIVLVVQLFTTRVVFNSLGIIDYGIVNVVSGFVAMFAFLNTTMANSIQRFYNIRLGKQKDTGITNEYNTALKVQGLLALILLLLLETVGRWYIYNKMIIPADRFPAAVAMFHFSVASLLVVVMQAPFSAAITAHERMKYYAYVSIFDVIAKLVVAYALSVTIHDRIILYAMLLFAVQVINFLMYFAYAKHHFSSLKLSHVAEHGLFRSMLSFSGWNIFGIFAYMFKSQGLNMLLNLFFGPVVNAARGISAMVMGAIQGFQTNTAIAFRPQMIQSYAAQDYDRVRALFFSLSKVIYLLLFMLSLPVILEMDYILHLWLGDTIPDYTIVFTNLVLADMIISSLSQPVLIVVQATGKMKRFQIVTGLIISSIVPISWIALKLGASVPVVYWVCLIVSILNQAVIIVILRQIFHFNYSSYLKEVILPCISCSLVASAISVLVPMFMEESFIRLCLTGAVAITVTITSAYMIVLNKNEKEMAKNAIAKIINRR